MFLLGGQVGARSTLIRGKLLLLILVGLGHSAGAQERQTLDAVLQKAEISPSSFSVLERSANVQDFIFAKDGSTTFLGYLTSEERVDPAAEMRVVRSEASGAVERSTVSLDGECQGSFESMDARQDWVVISFHENPSAGCVVVVREDLKSSDQIYAEGVMARVAGGLVLVGSVPHFAPTHPNPVLLYEFASHRRVTLYPGLGDTRRDAFVAKLRRLMPAAASCRKMQLACDPLGFSTNPDHFVVKAGGKVFRFTVTMSAEGFGERAERGLPDNTVGYICRLLKGKWVVSPE